MSSAVAGVVAVATLITALLGIAGLFRKVKEIHVLVNSQLSQMMARVEQLTKAMEAAGMQVPPRPGDGDTPKPGIA